VLSSLAHQSSRIKCLAATILVLVDRVRNSRTVMEGDSYD